MATAWVRQLPARCGQAKGSWYVFWTEPSGKVRRKSYGPVLRGAGKNGKKLAEHAAAALNAELKLGRYQAVRSMTWTEFLSDYTSGQLARKSAATREAYLPSLGHFERLCKLDRALLGSITARTIEQFIDKRLREPGSKPDSTVSVATVNKDLRAIKAALNKARKLGYLEAIPTIEFLKEPEQLPPFITDLHFAAIFKACDIARWPKDHPRPTDWWRGLLVMDILTGWRIGELLSLEWRDVDLEQAYAITRASANKGKRDGVVWLHEKVREHLAVLRITDEPRALVFPWHAHRRQLYDEFHRIQRAAGITLDCRIERAHTCTAACSMYGFHDGRRAFATHNSMNMSREALKVLMRHASESTTAKYINYAQQIRPAAQALHVPAVLLTTAVPKLPAPDVTGP